MSYRIDTISNRGSPPPILLRRHWREGKRVRKETVANLTRRPECLAAIRRIALNIVRLMDDDNSLKGRMEIAALSDKYLIGLLVNAVGKFLNERHGEPKQQLVYPSGMCESAAIEHRNHRSQICGNGFIAQEEKQYPGCIPRDRGRPGGLRN